MGLNILSGGVLLSDNKDLEKEYGHIDDIVDYQGNMYNPGHYVGTGRVPPTLSAPGNATPLAVLYFFASVLFAALGFFLFFSDVRVTGFGDSDILNKSIALVVMLGIAAFFVFLGIVYTKKAIKYYRAKQAMEREPIDNTAEDEIIKRTCPECGKNHDIDYPKCPYCKHNYLE